MFGLTVAEFIDHADGQGCGEDGAAAAGGIFETEEAEAGLGAEGPVLVELPVDGLGEAGAAAGEVDRVGLGVLLLDEAEEGVFEEAAAGEGGQAAGFIDGEEVGVFEQQFEGLRGGGLHPGGDGSRRGIRGRWRAGRRG